MKLGKHWVVEGAGSALLVCANCMTWALNAGMASTGVGANPTRFRRVARFVGA